jgi:acyl-coenzyme A synthetase/AMP-(fatty) acid ligase
MNFATDVVEAAPPRARALVEIGRDGARRESSFGEVAAASGALAGRFEAGGLRRGDVVLTVVGNRHEWALSMVACFRLGLVVLPCTEHLRPKDLERGCAAPPRSCTTRASIRTSGSTGQLTGMPVGVPAHPGSMGVPLPGVRLGVLEGELVADPSTVPTFFLRYLGEPPPASDVGAPATA